VVPGMASSREWREVGWIDVGTAMLITLAALLACGGATEDQLKVRSAFDLNCPQEQITLTQIDVRTRGVSGCGQRATYVESCDAPRGSAGATCTWVLNSNTYPLGPKSDSAASPLAETAPAAHSSQSTPPPAPSAVRESGKAGWGF